MKVKILADENVNYKIVQYLKSKNVDVVSLTDFHRGISDYEVIRLAKKLKAVILTEDSDFGTWAFSLKENINGVIYIRYKPEDYLEIGDTVVSLVDKYDKELYNRFITITKNKVRIRTL
ncbi:MAG: toxin-antitoxin system, toxin component [Aquificae bacterium]|nr:toxin-antitoxin system, toxin component [Aquificota bacterium]